MASLKKESTYSQLIEHILSRDEKCELLSFPNFLEKFIDANKKKLHNLGSSFKRGAYRDHLAHQKFEWIF